MKTDKELLNELKKEIEAGIILQTKRIRSFMIRTVLLITLQAIIIAFYWRMENSLFNIIVRSVLYVCFIIFSVSLIKTTIIWFSLRSITKRKGKIDIRIEAFEEAFEEEDTPDK
jgi:hypothetical protein